MIARGIVPVGHPVDAEGAATSSWQAMAGVAGRGGGDRTAWQEGEDFPLITEIGCLIVLADPMDLTIGGVAYRLGARENYYVNLVRGKIVDFTGRNRKG